MDAKYISQFVANLPAVQFAQSVIGSLPIVGQATDLSNLRLTKVAASADAAGGMSGRARSAPGGRLAPTSRVAESDSLQKTTGDPRPTKPAGAQKRARASAPAADADVGGTTALIKSLRLKGFRNEERAADEPEVNEEAKDVTNLARALRLKGFAKPANDQ